MKLVSWNVNGIRACITKGFEESIKALDADIVCIQESKGQPKDPENLLKSHPHQVWNLAQKKGYSGVAVFSKKKPISVQLGMNKPQHDTEGRIIRLEFPDYFLVNLYTPNAQRGLTRLDYRQSWDREFLSFIKKLEQIKPVVFCGDLNVAHQEIDLANPKGNHHNAGFTDEERHGFNKILNAGYLDSFRVFHQEPGQYTWWSYQFDSRSKNIGWRIDYVLVSQQLASKLKNAFIWPDIMGSDHCPVGIEIAL